MHPGDHYRIYGTRTNANGRCIVNVECSQAMNPSIPFAPGLLIHLTGLRPAQLIPREMVKLNDAARAFRVLARLLTG